MELYSSNDSYKLYKGDMRNMLDVIQKESIDAVLTDPPYELNFMGKGWDNSGIAFQKETWQKCYEVLKPGGYLLAFGGSRTFHRIACAIEDAGFEIRDTIMWLYGSGFPKSMSLGKVIEGKQVLGSANVKDIKKLKGKKEIVGGGWNSNEVEQGKRKIEYEQIKTEVEYTTELGKKWNGWGTALKPSFEPIIVARKPFKGSLVDNVIENGVGGINIDECRVSFNGDKWNNQKSGSTAKAFNLNEQQREAGTGILAGYECRANDNGRFPANTILTYDETDFDEVCGGFPYTKGDNRTSKPTYDKSIWGNAKSVESSCLYADSGSASRYFYCAKASKKDRDEGLDEFEELKVNLKINGGDRANDDKHIYNKTSVIRRNIHPTVKPTELMQYLVRLVTPNGGTILDPFNGSGSTGKAAMYENRERNKNYKYIGIELTEEYLPIAKARIEYVCNLPKEQKQSTIFDYLGDDDE